jgi:hypothetical protein
MSDLVFERPRRSSSWRDMKKEEEEIMSDSDASAAFVRRVATLLRLALPASSPLLRRAQAPLPKVPEEVKFARRFKDQPRREGQAPRCPQAP